MLADNLGVDRRWIHSCPLSEVEAKPQTVEKRSAADDPLEAEGANEISQRVRRIGEDEDHGIRGRLEKRREDVLINPDVDIDQLSPSSRFLPIGRPACF